AACGGYSCRPRRSGRPSVLVVKPAQHGDGDHSLLSISARRCQGARDGHRGALADSLVGPAAVEVAGVLRQDASQVPLPEDQDVVHALAPDAAEEAFADGVGARRADRRPDHLYPARSGEAVELGPVLGVVVVDQEARSGPLRRRLAQLLRRPRPGRRARDADVHHPPRTELDDEEGEDGSEERVGELEEVARPGLAAVDAQEGGPGLAGRAPWTRRSDVLLDGALADANPQLQQLSLDALGAPEVVLAGHPPDERDRRRRDVRRPTTCRRPPAPEEPEALAVPAQQRLGSDDQDVWRHAR